ncbi:hypothetical protein [Pseudomonas sp. Leaf48]
MFGMGNPLGHAWRGKAADAGDQIRQQHEESIMCEIEYDLPTLW